MNTNKLYQKWVSTNFNGLSPYTLLQTLAKSIYNTYDVKKLTTYENELVNVDLYKYFTGERTDETTPVYELLQEIVTKEFEDVEDEPVLEFEDFTLEDEDEPVKEIEFYESSLIEQNYWDEPVSKAHKDIKDIYDYLGVDTYTSVLGSLNGLFCFRVFRKFLEETGTLVHYERTNDPHFTGFPNTLYDIIYASQCKLPRHSFIATVQYGHGLRVEATVFYVGKDKFRIFVTPDVYSYECDPVVTERINALFNEYNAKDHIRLIQELLPVTK